VTTGHILLGIAGILLGGGVLTGAVWWVVSGLFGLRARLALVEGEIQHLKAEIAQIHSTCHGRELWLQSTCNTMGRIDKNVVKIAAKLDIEIEE